MVSLVGAEYTMVQKPEPEDVAFWLGTNAGPLVEAAKQFGYEPYLGAWYNEQDRLWYLDVSVRACSVHSALTLAKRGKQKAIFDVSRNETIVL